MSESSDSLFSFHRGRRGRGVRERREEIAEAPVVDAGSASADQEEGRGTHPLSEYHTLDAVSHGALNEMLETLQRRREKSETDLRKRAAAARRSKLNLSFLSTRRASQQAQQQEKNSEIVRQENTKLKQRLAKLEMDQVELSSLRHKVAELEWALDVVRDDAERVREDAIAVLSGIESQRRATHV